MLSINMFECAEAENIYSLGVSGLVYLMVIQPALVETGGRELESRDKEVIDVVTEKV